MKVQVTDNENNSCWNVSTAYITDIVDSIIYIDKGLIRDYRSDKNGLEPKLENNQFDEHELGNLVFEKK